MSKNLTRKGLALGAVVALGATLLAGSPAFAANEINVAPAAGTSYNIASGSQFTLATTFAPGYTPSAYAQLKYLVTTDANSTAKFSTSKHNDAALATAVSGATAQAVSTTSSAVAGSADAATDVSYLGLSAVTTTVTSTVTVTAFVDANNDGALTAGEWNTVKTVTFKKAADITPVVSLTAPATGDTSVKATVAWGDLNVDQMTAEAVKFTVAGGVATAGTYSSTTGIWTLGSLSAIASGAAVTAQAYNDTVALGTAASATATARTISSVTANLVKGADAIATSATTGATSTNGTVRANGSFVASVKALDTATTPVAAPAVAVKATVAVTGATLAALSSSNTTEVSVTVNGTKYTDATALAAASWALTTDASGSASVAVSTAGFTAGSSSVTVTFAAQNFSSAVVAAETAAAYTVSDDGASTVVATNKNTATALAYSVKDQFGTLSARTNERLVIGATNAAVATQYITVSAGKASFNVAATTDSAADVVVTSHLEISTNTNGTITWTTDGTDSVTNTLKIRSAAYSFTVAPAIDATAGINGGAWTATGAQKQTLTSYDQTDSTLTTGLVAPAAGTVWAKVTLTGSNAGEKLTVSGTGVFLSIDGAAATKDSATKVAQGTAVVVYVASTTAGAKTLTITNGSVSATVVVTFDKAAATAAAAIALGDLASVSQAGRSLDVSAIVTDKFGNAVQGATVTLSATGVGYLANTTATTDANGKVAGKLVVGALENGDAVVTASVTLADATVKTVSKTASFGATDAQIDIVGKRVTAVTSFSKGKTVAFYVDGVKKWSKLSASDADVVLYYNLKKGTHNVAVKISGGFVTTEKFIVQ